MCDVLATELEVFETHRSEWLAEHKGHFALIKGAEVAGIFQSETDAIAIGYQRFGNQPFLVKRIVETEEPIRYVSSFLAV